MPLMGIWRLRRCRGARGVWQQAKPLPYQLEPARTCTHTRTPYDTHVLGPSVTQHDLPGPHVLFGVPVLEPHNVQAPGLVVLGDLALMPAMARKPHAVCAPNTEKEIQA